MSWNTVYNFGEYLQELNTLSIFLRLFLAMLFGAVIGIDRSRKNRPAGFRTHMLVCMGSALVMITNQYITLHFPTTDPARLGAQVISGIGFLGAGTIIVTRSNQVRGLTTAAGLWASACIGLTLGIGFFGGAIIAEGFIIFIVTFMHRLDAYIHAHSKTMEVYAEVQEPSHLSGLIAYVGEQAFEMPHLDVIRPQNPTSSYAVIMTLKLPKKSKRLDIVQRLRVLDGVIYAEEV